MARLHEINNTHSMFLWKARFSSTIFLFIKFQVVVWYFLVEGSTKTGWHSCILWQFDRAKAIQLSIAFWSLTFANVFPCDVKLLMFTITSFSFLQRVFEESGTVNPLQIACLVPKVSLITYPANKVWEAASKIKHLFDLQASQGGTVQGENRFILKI